MKLLMIGSLECKGTMKSPYKGDSINASAYEALKTAQENIGTEYQIVGGVDRRGQLIHDRRLMQILSSVAIAHGVKHSTRWDYDTSSRVLFCPVVSTVDSPVDKMRRKVRKSTSVNADIVVIDKARRIGKGNASEGFRVAVEAFDESTSAADDYYKAGEEKPGDLI